ncbi:hypothetical protein [Lysinibacillus sp. BPa_S21]|uniref:hypothetical protein n=1 Tax=Lysinibacillus sp. BPa_S21 TaxID=2932478 RepID=UPI0020116D7A|nr:hypothetical protein [Lysinibacillus sp. BPa_S21]MCL1696404.1 hypothetical protein [Lysinibacillus sp. BPa_S21]
MTTTYKIYDENDNPYGSFNKYDDSVELAQEMADELNRDMFIYELKKELIKCVIPE